MREELRWDLRSSTFLYERIERGMKGPFGRRVVMLLGIYLILLLALGSVYAAFLGSETTTRYVNSFPVGLLWALFGLSSLAAMVFIPTTRRRLPIWLIHVGLFLIILGAMLGSESFHHFTQKLYENGALRKGYLLIYEGQTKNRIVSSNGNLQGKLPFSLKLKDFQVVYDETGEILVRSPGGKMVVLPAEVGRNYPLNCGDMTLRVNKSYKNYRIRFENQRKIDIDEPGSGSNPALEIGLKGKTLMSAKTQVIFPNLPFRPDQDEDCTLEYRRLVRNFCSDVQLLVGGRALIDDQISGGYPLRFQGYHIYQHAYDQKSHKYSVLLLVSDRGLNLVYWGFVCLCGGMIWHFWLGGLHRRFTAMRT